MTGASEAGCDKLGRAERAVYKLLAERDEQRPWSLHELGLTIGDPADAADAVRHLRGVGLIHELDGFVWASRAALAADAMAG
jgi:hypothetical protein